MEVMEVIKLGYMDNGTGQHQSNTVISTEGLSPAITTLQGGTQQIKILVRSEDERKQKPKLVGGIGKINFGKQYRQGNRVYDSKAIAMALTAQPLGNSGGYSYLYLVEVHDGSKETR